MNQRALTGWREPLSTHKHPRSINIDHSHPSRIPASCTVQHVPRRLPLAYMRSREICGRCGLRSTRRGWRAATSRPRFHFLLQRVLARCFQNFHDRGEMKGSRGPDYEKHRKISLVVVASDAFCLFLTHFFQIRAVVHEYIAPPFLKLQSF